VAAHGVDLRIWLDKSAFGWRGRCCHRGSRKVIGSPQLNLAEVPVIVLGHLSEAQKRALVIADNQLALNSGWDEELLRIELATLQECDYDLSLLGIEDEELARLLASQDITDGLTNEDEIPTPPATPLSKLGDLWFWVSIV